MGKVLVTGINGFVGEHLAHQLKVAGFSIIGSAREQSANNRVAAYLESYIQCDFLDESAVAALELGQLDAIVHLAGLSSVGQSFSHPKEYMTNNGVMVHNLLSTAATQSFEGRALIISTGALYSAKQPMPLSETSEIANSTPYAVGKLFAEGVASYYDSRGLDVVVARPFNHIGPNQGPGFLLPDLYEQIMQVKAGRIGAITVGDLSTKRDYTDVRDIVKAYQSLISADSLDFTLYNISSGVSLSGNEILEELKRAVGMEDLKVTIDESKLRPNDTQIIVGDSSRISTELGWKPEIPINQTVRDFVSNQ